MHIFVSRSAAFETSQRIRIVARRGEQLSAVAREPLAFVATVLRDTGMRPEECYRLRWEYVTWVNGRYGSAGDARKDRAAARRLLQ
jgi:integrase